MAVLPYDPWIIQDPPRGLMHDPIATKTTWLMQGEAFTKDEATSRLVQLDSHKSYLPVSTRAEVYYRARPGKLITCVIAASVRQRGHVSVVEGGYGAREVRIRYMTENGEPDEFFVLIQAARREPVSVEGNAVRSSRLGVVYEPMTNWTREEIEDALRNNTDIFPS
ncbi:uncharacterized protein LOC112452514 isoform X1 [Temnothorax curvispinosus]|uniref:Uncharacterized protein LOC112452514 isoform X1 n=1 Tax=Temnothorax curvispinosus TaxID=300111 RepID=A0A6J1PG42_9HYME|nr:uncharacterized protein LOC112452514 isoform X1 [Temnothorax curvispinosus]XP_024868546.1 uncharacterized protein LOC112452514 isoform X1 [Temnothorax curvispinosus]